MSCSHCFTFVFISNVFHCDSGGRCGTQFVSAILRPYESVPGVQKVADTFSRNDGAVTLPGVQYWFGVSEWMAKRTARTRVWRRVWRRLHRPTVVTWAEREKKCDIMNLTCCRQWRPEGAMTLADLCTVKMDAHWSRICPGDSFLRRVYLENHVLEK